MKRRDMGPKFLLATAVLAVLPALPAAAQESGDRVGDVVRAVGRVTGQPEGGAIAALAVGDPVLIEMRVRTGQESGAHFTFDPRGSLQLSAGADVRIDRATLDEAGASNGAITVFLGYVRASLSSLFRGNFQVETSAATIGVKGTVFGVRAVDDGTTTVWAFEALGDDLTVTSNATGDSLVLESGYVTVVAPGAAPTQPIPFDPKTGAAGGLVLPLPEGLPDVFDEPPLPPGDNDLPPDRGNDFGPPGVFDDPTGQAAPPPSAGGKEPGDDG